jgi:REP element-mobilizing transposase RayT
MDDSPLAYFFTWTTYGTWLPGDERGWVDGATHEMHFTGNPARQEQARARMVETPVTLTPEQRQLVEEVIRKHCRIRGWTLHAVNVRTQHVHVVASIDRAPKIALAELKAWCTRRLKEREPGRQHWWSEGGCKTPLEEEDDLEGVIVYVRDCQ